MTLVRPGQDAFLERMEADKTKRDSKKQINELKKTGIRRFLQTHFSRHPSLASPECKIQKRGEIFRFLRWTGGCQGRRWENVGEKEGKVEWEGQE